MLCSLFFGVCLGCCGAGAERRRGASSHCVDSFLEARLRWQQRQQQSALTRSSYDHHAIAHVTPLRLPDLTKYGSHVYVLVRRGELRASKIMAKRLMSHPKVTILWNTVAVECQGDGDLLNRLKIKDVKTGEEK